MIAKLKGKVDELKPTEIIIDVGGVGYHLAVPFSTYEKIKKLQEVNLFVYTYHKEDQFKLFGFYEEKEKKLFSILLSISGIGPTMALSILSGIEISELIDAVRSENPALLVKIPGIGKSKADKLVFELRRKLKKLKEFTVDYAPRSSVYNDSLDALTSLGFDEKKSQKVLDSIINLKPEITIEDLVKEAIKSISG